MKNEDLKKKFTMAIADNNPNNLYGFDRDDVMILFMAEVINLLKSINGNIEANSALLESIDRSTYEK